MPLSLPGNPANVLLQGYDTSDFQKMRNANTAAHDQHNWMGLQSQESQQKIDEEKYRVNARTLSDQKWADIYNKPKTAAGSAPDATSASNDTVTTLPGDSSTPSPASPAGSDSSGAGVASAPVVGSGASAAAPSGDQGADTDDPATPGQAANPLTQMGQSAGTSPSASPAAKPALPPVSPEQQRDADTAEYVAAMNKAGYHSYGMAVNGALQKGYKEAAELYDKELETVQRKVELTGDIMQSVTKVDTAADPATQTAQMETWKQTAAAAVGKLAQNGLITPQQGQAMLQKVAEGWNPQVAQQIEAQAQSAKNHAANLNAAREQSQVAQKMVQEGLTIDKAKAEVLKANLVNMGQSLPGVAASQDSIDRFVARQAPGVQKEMAETAADTRLSPQEKLDRFGEMGLSDVQRSARDARADALGVRADQYAQTNEYKRIAADQRQEMIDLHRYQADHDKVADRQQTARDDAQLNRLQASERGLYAKRSRLGTQLENADKGAEFQYIQANGTTKPSAMMRDKKKNLDPKEVASATSDMRAQYDAATEQLKEIVNQKYDITKDSGTKTRDQALHEVEFGKDKPDAAPASAPPVSQTTASAPKAAAPQASAAIPNFPGALASGMAVGVPKQIRDKHGNVQTVIKRADGKVYQQ